MRKINEINIQWTNKIRYVVTLVGTAFFMLVLFGSCSKDESPLDVLAKEMGDLPNSYMERAVQLELGGNYYSVTEEYRGIPIRLKEKASQEIIVEGAVDVSLVATYNNTFSEKNESLPEGAFKLSHDGKYTVNAQQAIATDSLHVLLADGSKLADSTVYLVPVRLKTQDKAQLVTSVVFFKVFVTKAPLQARLTGGLLAETTPTLGPLGYDIFATIKYDDFMAKDTYTLQVPVSLTRAFTFKDVHIKAKLYSNSEVVSQYSKWNSVFPQGTLILKTGSVTVPAGKLSTEDKMEVSFSNKEKLSKFTSYTMLLTIESDNEDPVSVSPINNELKNIYVTVFLY